MTENPFFFPHGDLSLFGVLHEAEGTAARLPVVFCHPFAEEKLWTHRMFVSFARELALRGHTVLRFDQAGNGDSEGEFSQSSVSGAVGDLSCAIDRLKEVTGSREVAVLGLRLGATLAALAVEERDDVRALVLWAPVVEGDRYAQDLLRVNLTTQVAVYKEVRQDRAALVQAMRAGEAVNVDGYALACQHYEQLTAIALASAPRRFGRPTLIVHIDRMDGARPTAELKELAGRYANATLLTVQEEPFWKEIPRFYETAPNLFTATLSWLEAR